MAFLVGFVHYVHSVFVAELVPARVVGIVACAHHIDVGLLHKFKVAAHQVFGNRPSGPWMVFVAVHAFHLDNLSVDFEEFAVHLNGAEAGLVAEGFGAVKRYFHIVEGRVLGGPK